MWYKFSTETNLNDIDSISNFVSNMNPYNTKNHLQLLKGPNIPRDLLPDNLDDRIETLYDSAQKSRDYLNIHPQIYIYPAKQYGVWRYIIYDPKHLQRMDNDDYYENLSTPLSISSSIDDVMMWVHQKYPTALIDFYETEEEMLRDARNLSWHKTSATKWATYEQAQQWARDNNIKSMKQYYATPKPLGIPGAPNYIYKNQWISWGNFLGTNNLAPSAWVQNFVSYEQAQQWVRQNNIKSMRQYFTTPKPHEIPSRPDLTYKNQWISWGAFLGTYNMAPADRGQDFVSYEQAQQWARDNNIISSQQYQNSPKPYGIPSSPWQFYKEWTNWRDFLGTNNLSPTQKSLQIVTYEQAKSWAQQQEFQSSTQYINAPKPQGIPLDPARIYKLFWEGWDKFLGNSYNPQQFKTPLKQREKQYASEREVKKWMRLQGITTPEEYKNSPYKLDYFPPTLDFYKQSNSFNLSKFRINI